RRNGGAPLHVSALRRARRHPVAEADARGHRRGTDDAPGAATPAPRCTASPGYLRARPRHRLPLQPLDPFGSFALGGRPPPRRRGPAAGPTNAADAPPGGALVSVRFVSFFRYTSAAGPRARLGPPERLHRLADPAAAPPRRDAAGALAPLLAVFARASPAHR